MRQQLKHRSWMNRLQEKIPRKQHKKYNERLKQEVTLSFIVEEEVAGVEWRVTHRQDKTRLMVSQAG